MRRRGLFFLTILFGFLLISETQAAETRKVEEKTFTLEEGGLFSLAANEGFISVTIGDGNQVTLKMTKVARARSRAEAEELLEYLDVDINESKRRLTIKERDRRRRRGNHSILDIFDGDFWRNQGRLRLYVDYEVVLPRGVHLNLACDEGDISVDGAEGDVSVAVDEGDVLLRRLVTRRLEVAVDEGDVELVDCEAQEGGYCKIESDEGYVTLKNCQFNDMDIHSDEGDVELTEMVLGGCWIATDEGDIYAEFTPGSEGSFRLETDEGDIEIVVPEKSSLNLRLMADEGHVDAPRFLERRRNDDGESRFGVMGKGEARLKAYSGEGDVILSVK